MQDNNNGSALEWGNEQETGVSISRDECTLIEVSWSEAIGRKYPEPTILVVSCDSKGKPNVMPAGWSMVTSGTPPMLAVSISHKDYTHMLIEDTDEFVLVFPNEEMKDLIDYTGSCSGRNKDKFAEYGIAI